MSRDLVRALGSASTLDRSARTVEVVMLSGLAPAVRPAPAPDGTNTPWVEELDAAGADLSRLRGGSVLKDHRPTTDSAVGVVEEVQVEGARIVGRLLFDGSAAAEELMGKVEVGSVRGVSLGYRVHEFRLVGRTDRGFPIFRAVRWTPHEISFTPTPVDAGAGTRSQHEDTMSVSTTTEGTTETAVVVTDATVQTRAQVNAEIRTIAKLAGLDHTFADAQIDAGATVDQARAAAFAEMAKRGGQQPIDTRTRVQVTNDNSDPVLIRSAMADALAFRVAPDRAKLEGRAREFAEWTVLDMVAELARSRGTPLDARNRITVADAIFTRSHSTSDFPLLLEAAANKTLLGAYQIAAPTFMRWAGMRSFTDFKPHKFLRLGDFPGMQEITAEGGEVQFGTISENRETIAAKEWATGIKINRRALINDDLGALGDFTGMAGRRIAYDQNAKMYELLQSNSGNGPVLADTYNVFDATHHGNKAGSGTTIDETNVSAGVIAMGAQTTLDGLKMNLRPRMIVCGPAKEIAARKLVASITPTQTSNVNVYAGQFEIVVDANVSGNRWYLFADPAAAPVFVHGYVSSGQAGPTARSEIDFDTLAVKLRVGMDWGYGAMDYRGVYTNAGA